MRLFAPNDEPELLAELRRLAGVEGEDGGAKADLDAAFRERALELMRFRPLRWDVARSFFTRREIRWRTVRRSGRCTSPRERASVFEPSAALLPVIRSREDVDDVPPPPLEPADEERLLSDFAAKHLRRWLDEPLPALGGETPREAVGGERRGEVIRLLRGIENHADRARRRGKPGADVAWLRDELAIGDELAA